jgi:hypothetical protein
VKALQSELDAEQERRLDIEKRAEATDEYRCNAPMCAESLSREAEQATCLPCEVAGQDCEDGDIGKMGYESDESDDDWDSSASDHLQLRWKAFSPAECESCKSNLRALK